MSRNGKKDAPAPQAPAEGAVKSKKAVENTATFGLILVAVGLAAPFTDLTNFEFIKIFKWIYAPGALIFTIARIVGSTDPAESMRVRRLRRLEFWAGVALCIGAFFWFYNEHRFGEFLRQGAATMTYLRETIYFTFAGAIIQVIASLSISRRLKKEAQAKK